MDRVEEGRRGAEGRGEARRGESLRDCTDERASGVWLGCQIVQRGEEIRVTMRSGDFDPFLQIRDPDGSVEKNDDCIPSSRHACLVHVVRSSGTLSILANSYQGWETGAYVLEFVGQGELAVGRAHRGWNNSRF